MSSHGYSDDIKRVGCSNCHTCAPNRIGSPMRMIVCPDCGNKRCPKANDHCNTCTGRNEPGQPGSAYPTVPTLDECQVIVAPLIEDIKRRAEAKRAELEATPEGRALLAEARKALELANGLTPAGVDAFVLPTACAMQVRPCRCGPDGCADSTCPGRRDG
jgi:hypothetical protein